MRLIMVMTMLGFLTTGAMAEDVTVKFTPQEAQVLRELINIAVKSVGLQAADAALTLDRKISAAQQKGPTDAKTSSAAPPAPAQ